MFQPPPHPPAHAFRPRSQLESDFKMHTRELRRERLASKVQSCLDLLDSARYCSSCRGADAPVKADSIVRRRLSAMVERTSWCNCSGGQDTIISKSTRLRQLQVDCPKVRQAHFGAEGRCLRAGYPTLLRKNPQDRGQSLLRACSEMWTHPAAKWWTSPDGQGRIARLREKIIFALPSMEGRRNLRLRPLQKLPLLLMLY